MVFLMPFFIGISAGAWYGARASTLNLNVTSVTFDLSED